MQWTSLTAARKNLNLETKDEHYQHLSASDIEKLADDLGSIKLGATAEKCQISQLNQYMVPLVDGTALRMNGWWNNGILRRCETSKQDSGWW
ncbi:hypothetical protein [uncultured Methanolobus sp.]|uniref:hypothetical protein n=1 Tax=uncultured Methanolobus sp. TaxID=218300 RepID=UPI0029C6B5FC|nr:hypothetical protein [uncultured Methanolobus sp.]